MKKVTNDDRKGEKVTNDDMGEGGRRYALNSSKASERGYNCAQPASLESLRPWYSFFCSKFGTGNVKEPNILKVYQIISGMGNVVMKETFDWHFS